MEYFSEIMSFLAGLVSGYAIKVIVNWRNEKRSNVVTQHSIKAGGDVVGGDLHKTDRTK